MQFDGQSGVNRQLLFRFVFRPISCLLYVFPLSLVTAIPICFCCQ